jgi:hypothetical protein
MRALNVAGLTCIGKGADVKPETKSYREISEVTTRFIQDAEEDAEETPEHTEGIQQAVLPQCAFYISCNPRK